MNYYDITPVSAPRQVRRDRWDPSPHVMKYRAFWDEVRLKRVDVPLFGAHIIFILPMPKSWTVKKRSEMVGQPHQNKPDVDNLAKALLDAIYTEDCHIFDYRISKIWGYNGGIVIGETGRADFTQIINQAAQCDRLQY